MVRSGGVYERKVVFTGVRETEQELVSFTVDDVREWVFSRKGGLCDNVGEAVVVEDVVHGVRESRQRLKRSRERKWYGLNVLSLLRSLERRAHGGLVPWKRRPPKIGAIDPGAPRRNLSPGAVRAEFVRCMDV